MMLDAHPNISCGPETLFLTWLQVAEQNSWRRLVRFGITQEQWRAHVRELFTWVHEQHARRDGKARWADKSPGYALMLDYVESLFPDCQVVHVIRDPRDVLDSWRRRWGVARARRVPRVWTQHVSAARSFGATRPPDRYTEIRYEDLVRDPEGVMRGLLEWLGEPWDDAVMSFKQDELHSEDHERAIWLGRPDERPAPTTRRTRRRRGDAEAREVDQFHGNGVFSSSVGIGVRPVNLAYALMLRRTSGALMRELGYH